MLKYNRYDELLDFAFLIYNHLQLKQPFELEYRERVLWGKEKYPCYGKYEWDSGRKMHTIIVEDTGKAVMQAVIAHEFIHAWQCEVGIKLSHGKVFKWWNKTLQNEFDLIDLK